MRLDHQWQTVGRNGGQSRKVWFSNPCSISATMNSGVELVEKIGMTLEAFANEPQPLCKGGGRMNYLIMHVYSSVLPAANAPGGSEQYEEIFYCLTR
jgi:hypothetical protein